MNLPGKLSSGPYGPGTNWTSVSRLSLWILLNYLCEKKTNCMPADYRIKYGNQGPSVYRVAAFQRTGHMFGNICQIILDLRGRG